MKQIAKLESWHWGIVIDNQRVTWTALRCFYYTVKSLKHPSEDGGRIKVIPRFYGVAVKKSLTSQLNQRIPYHFVASTSTHMDNGHQKKRNEEADVTQHRLQCWLAAAAESGVAQITRNYTSSPSIITTISLWYYLKGRKQENWTLQIILVALAKKHWYFALSREHLEILQGSQKKSYIWF